MRLKQFIFAAATTFLSIVVLILLARFIPPNTAGVIIAAMSGFSALSTAFGFQILSLRREVRRTEGLDEDRRILLRKRLDRSLRTLFLRWSLSFACGIFGAACGLVIREAKEARGGWSLVAVGILLCASSIFFLLLMILEYRSLLHFATELEERAEQIKERRRWAERMGKIAKG